MDTTAALNYEHRGIAEKGLQYRTTTTQKDLHHTENGLADNASRN